MSPSLKNRLHSFFLPFSHHHCCCEWKWDLPFFVCALHLLTQKKNFIYAHNFITLLFMAAIRNYSNWKIFSRLTKIYIVLCCWWWYISTHDDIKYSFIRCLLLNGSLYSSMQLLMYNLSKVRELHCSQMGLWENNESTVTAENDNDDYDEDEEWNEWNSSKN